MYKTASQKITRNKKIISSYLEIKLKSWEILSNLQTDILKSSHLHLRYRLYAEGFPEKYARLSFYSQKVNEIYGTAFGLWSSTKLNCCWAQQPLPVTSYLNNEKWAASGLLEKGNRRAGRCPSGIAKAAMPPWVRGQPAAGARRGPAAAVRSRDTAEPSQRRAKPGGHNVSWAATEAAPAGWRGRKDDFGEWDFPPVHRHVRFDLTAASVPLSSTRFVPHSWYQDKTKR